MLDLLCGAAFAAVFLGVSSLCDSIQSKNKELKNQIKEKTIENSKLLSEHKEKLQSMVGLYNQKDELDRIIASKLSAIKSSDLIYQNYKSMKKTVSILYKQLDKLKNERNKISKLQYNKDIQSEQKLEIKKKLLDLNEAIRIYYIDINSNNQKLDEFNDTLKQFNDLVKTYKNREKELKNNLKLPYQTKICKDCGNNFTITKSEYVFFTKKDLSLPCRCQECRSLRKAA